MDMEEEIAQITGTLAGTDDSWSCRLRIELIKE
jgi:hypothetical protein